MKASSTNQAIDILITVTDYEAARKLLLGILKCAPSAIVKGSQSVGMSPPDTGTLPSAPQYIVGVSPQMTAEEIKTWQDNCIATYLRQYTFIATIRWVRLLTGLHLKEVKEIVEDIRTARCISPGAANGVVILRSIDENTSHLLRVLWEYGAKKTVDFMLARDSKLTELEAEITIKRLQTTYSLHS